MERCIDRERKDLVRGVMDHDINASDGVIAASQCLHIAHLELGVLNARKLGSLGRLLGHALANIRGKSMQRDNR